PGRRVLQRDRGIGHLRRHPRTRHRPPLRRHGHRPDTAGTPGRTRPARRRTGRSDRRPRRRQRLRGGRRRLIMAGSLLAPAPPAPDPAAPGGRLHRLRRALSERRTRFGLLNATPVVVYLLVLFVYPIFGTLLLSLKAENGGW